MKKYFTMITMLMALIAAPVMAHAADNATLIAQDEKLAPDVYQKLYQRWQKRSERRISFQYRKR